MTDLQRETGIPEVFIFSVAAICTEIINSGKNHNMKTILSLNMFIYTNLVIIIITFQAHRGIEAGMGEIRWPDELKYFQYRTRKIIHFNSFT